MLGGKFNIANFLKNSAKIQEIIQKTQEELSKIRVTAESGAGLVKVATTAHPDREFTIELMDELFQEPKPVIQELIQAAVNNANRKASKIAQEKMTSPESFLGSLSEDKED